MGLLLAFVQYLRYYKRAEYKSIPQVSSLGGHMEDAAMTSEHVRAARALLRWEQRDLAKRSGVSLPSVKRLETQPGALAAQATTVAALRKAFEDVGIEFLNGGQPGARLVKSEPKAKPKRRR
jgi:hypothetical protein